MIAWVGNPEYSPSELLKTNGEEEGQGDDDEHLADAYVTSSSQLQKSGSHPPGERITEPSPQMPMILLLVVLGQTGVSVVDAGVGHGRTKS